jgi:probable addiction module antidote protein
MTDISHDLAMSHILRDDPELAVGLLNDILKDGDPSELLIALRQMAEAFGGVSAVAIAAELNPTQLYRTLSKNGNPNLKSLTGVLKAMGLRLAVEPLPQIEAA